MKYNTNRKTMPFPEYGRNVHLMAEHLLEISDREKRTLAAHNIISLMAQQNSQAKNQPEFQQKLWDHLHVMTDFKLDVDSDFPKLEKSLYTKKAVRKISYPNNKPRYRFYGRSLELAIEKAANMPDGEEKEYLINSLLTYMVVSYKSFNFEKVADEVIIRHMDELSKGKIKVETIPEVNITIEKPFQRKFKAKKSKKKKRKPQF